MLSYAGRPWWVAGGLALSLFAGKEIRAHHDLDVVILEEHALDFRRILASWEVCAAVGWAGPSRASRRILRPLPVGDPLPEDAEALWCRPSSEIPWSLELLINPSEGDLWQFKRDPTLTRPLAQVGSSSTSGVPFLLPEIVLLHKATAGDITEQDTEDLSAVVELMTVSQKAWLTGAISRYASAHPWLETLARSA